MSGVLLVDANNLTMRSFLAPKGDMSSHEIETGTLVLFINTLARHIKMEQPDRVAVCWDGGASAYRMMIFPQYKANRPQKYVDVDDPKPPFDIITEFLKLSGIPQLLLPGYEGDDLIAAFWRACRGHQRIFILSGDKDMMQLIEDGTEQLKPISAQSRPDRWNRSRVIEELGYRPDDIVAVMALMGDKIDGIPGLPKVGPKTAVKMLKQFDWDFGKLIDSLPKDQQFVVLRNAALVDLSCVPLELDVPPILELVTPDDKIRWPELEAFLDFYELKSIKTRLVSGTLWR
jgi:DNA polymerase-1